MGFHFRAQLYVAVVAIVCIINIFNTTRLGGIPLCPLLMQSWFLLSFVSQPAFLISECCVKVSLLPAHPMTTLIMRYDQTIR